MRMKCQREREFELRMRTKELNALDEDLQRWEVERVLKGVKNGKSTGMGGIPYEMYKHGGKQIVDMMC